MDTLLHVDADGKLAMCSKMQRDRHETEACAYVSGRTVEDDAGL